MTIKEALNLSDTAAESIADYIQLEDLRGNWLYVVAARNITFGVWSAATQSFYGIRQKFGDRFIDDEYHWNHCYKGQEDGTAKPLLAICECPAKVGDTRALFEYLDGCRARIEKEMI